MEEVRGPAVRHPELLPLLGNVVVLVEAFAVAALSASPILEDDAVLQDELHAAFADLLLAREDIPLADPEVELPVLRIRGVFAWLGCAPGRRDEILKSRLTAQAGEIGIVRDRTRQSWTC